MILRPARDGAENGADMSYKKIGKQTVRFSEKPCITGRGNVVGEKEGQGPLGKCFDLVLDDDMYGEKSWEMAESKMLKEAMERAVTSHGIEVMVVEVFGIVGVEVE